MESERQPKAFRLPPVEQPIAAPKLPRTQMPLHPEVLGDTEEQAGAGPSIAYIDPRDAEIAALKVAVRQLDDTVSYLMDAPVIDEPANAHNFPENLTDRLSDWDTVQDEASLTTADLTEEVIQRLTAAKRKKFTELLNVELAELQQERGGPREDLPREAEIEKLLGLFARVGEM